MGMQGNHRVMYIEEVVMDGSGTVAVIRSMENIYELVIVGRRHNKRSGLTLGLRDWTNELSDLGEIGDVLASSDFGGNTTVLVVQQHTNVVSERHEDQIDNLREQNLKLFPADTVEEEADDVPMQRRST
ncbi:hypothetical protein L1049_002611 [Liquidambar formosana]|uniref:Uncharacterized protein n=1 Tax=Liquidambar formosana TaxID=63359 RepID=A0AAP0NI78_LIQFO